MVALQFIEIYCIMNNRGKEDPVKKTFFCFFALALLLENAAAQQNAVSLDRAVEQLAGNIENLLENQTKIAFVYINSPSSEISAYIIQKLYEILELNGKLIKADESGMNIIRNILEFAPSDSVSDETALGIGKILEAGYVLTGSFVRENSGGRLKVSTIETETAELVSFLSLSIADDEKLARLLSNVAISSVKAAAPAAQTAETPDSQTEKTQNIKTDDWIPPKGIQVTYAGKKDNPDGNAAAPDKPVSDEAQPEFVQNSSVTENAQAENAEAEEGLSMDGLSAEERYELAYTYYFKGRYDDALAEFGRAINLKNDFADAYAGRGNVFFSMKDYEKSSASYAEAVRLKPDYAPYSRGLECRITGDTNQAIIEFTEAIRLMPEYVFAYNNRGVCYSGKSDYDRAIADYSQAIKLNPGYITAYSNRGIAYRYKNDYNHSISDYNKAIQLNPLDPVAYYNRGLLNYYRRDYDRAIADYSEAIRLNPDYVRAYNNRGNAYKAKGQEARAGEDYAEAKRLSAK
jgi:tetratricopeptide (TPR) repeat protein